MVTTAWPIARTIMITTVMVIATMTTTTTTIAITTRVKAASRFASARARP